jgi:hypothetical protein
VACLSREMYSLGMGTRQHLALAVAARHRPCIGTTHKRLMSPGGRMAFQEVPPDGRSEDARQRRDPWSIAASGPPN